jgi:hypothetical protein
MVLINNSDTINEIIEVAKLKVSSDGIINNLQNNIVPVIDVNPKHSRRITIFKRGATTTTTEAGLYTTPTDRDFYLIGCTLSYKKDVTSDSTNAYLRGVIYGDNSATIILNLDSETLTANHDHIELVFPIPLKMARGQAITYRMPITAGTMVVAGEIFGYLDQVSDN